MTKLANARQDNQRAGTRRSSVVAWMRLARVYHRIDRATVELMRAHELTVAQFDVLARVGAGEGMTQTELAAALLVTKGNICQLIDRMEARGLVQRRPARTGRGNHLYLTDEGRRLNRLLVPTQEDVIDRTFAALTAAEQADLLALLRKLERSLTDHEEED